MTSTRQLKFVLLATCLGIVLCRAQSGRASFSDLNDVTDASVPNSLSADLPTRPIGPDPRLSSLGTTRVSSVTISYANHPIVGQTLESFYRFYKQPRAFPFLGDCFLPAISYRLQSDELSNKLLTRVSDYRIEKHRLLAELRAGIDRIASASPAEQKAMYADLASQQSLRILALEAREEELRSELSSGMFSRDIGSYKRLLQLPNGDFRSSTVDYSNENLAVCAFAYYQDGLSAPQRDLLRELSYDLLDKMTRSKRDSGVMDAVETAIYFSPSPVRIYLPRKIPGELEEKIIQYKDLKSSMKHALRELVSLHALDTFASTRAKAVRELVANQAEQFVKLDRLAEEIRVGLAPLQQQEEPNLSRLPAGIAPLATAYFKTKAELQRALAMTLVETQAILPRDMVAIAPMQGTNGIEIQKALGKAKDQAAKREAQRAVLKTFNQEQIERQRLLALQKDQLEKELAALSNSPAPGEPFSSAVPRNVQRLFKQIDTWNLYRDYRIAMFEPGLSPEQRRLLCGSALEILMACVNR